MIDAAALLRAVAWAGTLADAFRAVEEQAQDAIARNTTAGVDFSMHQGSPPAAE